MKDFWQNLKKPIMVLAPMEDVTDTVFRQIVVKAARPDVFFTEFTNTDGLMSKGREKVIRRFEFTKQERPIIAQIWGNNPKNYFESAKLIQKLQFDGIDINMGCPDKSIVARSCCSGLINNPTLAKEIVLSTIEGASDLPVSVKTRIGYSTIQTEEWIGFLLDLPIQALTIHGRTTKEMSKVPAHWDEIGKAVQIREAKKKDTVIIGNGDVTSYADGLDKVEQYGVDGIMIGRGIFSNLWIFDKNVDPLTVSVVDRLTLLIDHLRLFDNTWSTAKNFDLLKKFYKVYISNFDDSSQLRTELMQLKNAHDTINALQDYLHKKAPA